MRLWSELFDGPAGPRDEQAHRLFELTVIGCALANLWAWVEPISRNPALLVPLGLARYVDLSFMLSAPAAACNAALASLLMGLGFARRWRYAYLASLLLFHLQYVARFCLGKSGHGANLVGFCLLALSLAELLFEERMDQRNAARGLSLLLAGLSYTLAGCCKLIATGPGWVDGHNLWLWISEKSLDNSSSFGVDRLNVVQQALLARHELGTVLLSFGLLSELLGFLVCFRRARRPMLAALLGMHLGIMVAMDISFLANMAILTSLLLTSGNST